VAITTSFGPAWLRKFEVVTDEIMTVNLGQHSQLAA
jgi:hypothetical protein